MEWIVERTENSFENVVRYSKDSLQHHGILGMKWGIRRYQNKDGSWTAAGKRRRTKQERTFDKDVKSAVRSLERRDKKRPQAMEKFAGRPYDNDAFTTELSWRLRKPIEDYVDLEELRYFDRPQYLDALKANMKDARKGLEEIAGYEGNQALESKKFKADLVSSLKSELGGPCDDEQKFKWAQHDQAVRMLESLRYTPATKLGMEMIVKKEEDYMREAERVIEGIIDRVQDRPIASYKGYTANAKDIVRRYTADKKWMNDYSSLEYLFTEHVDGKKLYPYTMDQYNELIRKGA